MAHGLHTVHVARRRIGRAQGGYTLVELMIVVVMIGVLASLAGQTYTIYRARAKRSERAWPSGPCSISRRHTRCATQYAGTFDELGFAIEGGQRLSPTGIQGHVYEYNLSQPWGAQSWYCSATGNIDGDEWLDVMIAEKAIQRSSKSAVQV